MMNRMAGVAALRCVLVFGMAAPVVAAAQAGEATSRPAGPERVILVLKTHYDLGYTAPLPEILDTYRTTMLDDVLGLIDATSARPEGEQFVWSVPGWPLVRMLDPVQTPQRRDATVAALRTERIAPLALPFTMHADALELEEIVRSLRFSSQIAREAGVALPGDAKVTDAPSAPWCLPTILTRAGVRFLFVGVNRVCVPPETPLLFWWEGPDGSRLLTMLVDAYGTGQIPPRDIGGFGDGLLPPKDWPYATWLAMIHTSDNEGPPSLEQFQQLLSQAKSRMPSASIRVGRLSDFADEILREKPDLPVVRADMPDAWIHGIMSMPRETKLARSVRPRIATLETLATLTQAWGARPLKIAPLVNTAYEKALLFGEHTWGMNVRKFGPRLYGQAWKEAHAAGTYAKLEDSWAEHGRHIVEAAQLVERELDAQMVRLAESVAVEGPRVVVFNPLPWERDGSAIVQIPGSARAVRDVATGEVLPAHVEGQTLTFRAKSLPPLGYRTYVPADPEDGPEWPELTVDEPAATFENAFLRVRLDPESGTIRSLVDKRSGRELAGTAGDTRLGQYLYERFSALEVDRYLDAYTRFKSPVSIGDFAKTDLPPASEAPYRSASPRGFRLNWVRSGPRVTAIMSAPASEEVPHAVSLSVTLTAGEPHLDLEWAVQDKSPEPWPEAGWLCLPVNAPEPSFRVGRAGAIIDPASDIQPASNHHLLCVNTGLTVTDARHQGVGICPLDAPLVSLDEPGLWRFSRRFVPKRPVVYVNLYNNQWGTNFAQWIGGSWSSRVRLWSVAGDDPEAALVRPSWEARLPYLAAAASDRAGKFPPTQAGIELSRAGVIVTAMGPNPDGPGTLLRLWEQVGSASPCQVRLPTALTAPTVQPCDLRGRVAGDALPTSDHAFEVRLEPYAPTSIRLR